MTHCNYHCFFFSVPPVCAGEPQQHAVSCAVGSFLRQALPRDGVAAPDGLYHVARQALQPAVPTRAAETSTRTRGAHRLEAGRTQQRPRGQDQVKWTRTGGRGIGVVRIGCLAVRIGCCTVRVGCYTVRIGCHAVQIGCHILWITCVNDIDLINGFVQARGMTCYNEIISK